MNSLTKRVPKVVKKGVLALSPMLGAVVLRRGLGFASTEFWPRLFPTPSFLGSLVETSAALWVISVFLGFVVFAVECIFNSEKDKGEERS